MKILLTSTSFQDTPGEHQHLLNSQNFDVDYLRGPVTEDILLPIIHDYDAVICGDDEYTRSVLRKGKEGRLKYISKYGVGLDKIDLEAAKDFDIPVKNCPGVNQVSVAEHVLALLFTFEKNIHLQYQSTKEASWERMIGTEIFGKTIGIIGLGAIGKELAKRSVALGMKTLSFDLERNEEFLGNHPEVHFIENLDQLFKESDIISLHIPHTGKTEGIISRDVIFNKLNKAPILINTSRGKLVDSSAVIDGLNSKKLKAYLTDVLEVEPIEEREILRRIDNVIITPHVGSRTYQSVEKQGAMAINNLLEMIKADKRF